VSALSFSITPDDSAVRSTVHCRPAVVGLVDRVVGAGALPCGANRRRTPGIEEQYLAQAVDAQDLQVRVFALARAQP
jgi:hypothetical protein